jgi:hypothetical protein
MTERELKEGKGVEGRKGSERKEGRKNGEGGCIKEGS